MEQKPLQLIEKPNLVFKRGQKELYELICKNLAANKPITYEEARSIYFSKGCNVMQDGWPHWTFYDYETKTWHHRPWSEEAVKYNTFNWLTNNIGRLVVKGALRIIPQIELT